MGVHEDFDRCRRAVQSKDSRFDGWFVTAVLTTRIYCRPSCPVRPPLARNMAFYPSAAAAQQAGFRACKRCRPDACPGSPEWNSRHDLVGRAMRLIADGVVDRHGVTGLAARLGYSTRQLERLLVAEVGAGPLALARAQRAQTARLLIETTAMSFVEIAFAAGFSSVRQFNDTVRMVYDTTPTTLRVGTRRRTSRGGHGTLRFRLAVRSPFFGDGLLTKLAASAVPGCEEVNGRTYRRTMRLPLGTGIAALTLDVDHVDCELQLDEVRDIPVAIARCRRMFDLDTDPEAIMECLHSDPAMAAVVDAAPGRRVLRTVDEAEMAIRVVIGQQISLAAARTHTRRLVERYGTPIDDPAGGLTHVVPSVETLVGLDPAHLGLPTSRRRCVTSLIEALASGAVELGPGADWDRARKELATLPGIGEWTCEMIAMRALGDPDAFPVTDLVLRRGAERLGLATTATALTEHARRWRPWRSSAVQYLWSKGT